MNLIYCSILLIVALAAVVEAQKIQLSRFNQYPFFRLFEMPILTKAGKLKFMCDDAINKVSDLGNGAGEQVLKTYEDCKNAIWAAYQKGTKGESKADKIKRIAKEYGEGAKDIIAAFRP